MTKLRQYIRPREQDLKHGNPGYVAVLFIQPLPAIEQMQSHPTSPLLPTCLARQYYPTKRNALDFPSI